MGFRALQLTHRSSKSHTQEETNTHRNKRDSITIDFNKHLIADRKTHDIPTRAECWPVDNIRAIDRSRPVPATSDTDSDFNEEELKDGELFADRIGKEVMSVGRMQYTKLKPLKLGDMVVLYSVDKTDSEEFYVGKAFAWNKDVEKKLTVWWHGYSGNAMTVANERKYYRGERVKDGTAQRFWVKPKGNIPKDREWLEVMDQDALVYWQTDGFLNNDGKINYYALEKIKKRMMYIKAMLT
jgi:hypothetical protein